MSIRGTLFVGSLCVLVACGRSTKKSGAGPGEDSAKARVAPADAATLVAEPARRDGGSGINFGAVSASLVPVPAAAAKLVKVVRVARGFKRPVALEHAPGESGGRLYVVEQHAGRIRILQNGRIKAGAFLDIGSKVSRSNEQGLLGLAFHPKFAANKKLYINYTDSNSATRVIEYTVSNSDADAVDMSSARELLKVKQPFSNHNAGDLEFGPDGKLYVGMGDGGAGGDPYGAGQNKKSLLGKMLRLDVDAVSSKPEIIQWGLRNPWRYAFDSKTGDFYIGDVGQNRWEEIDVVSFSKISGVNFGWNVMEGTHCFNPPIKCTSTGMTPPVIEYRNPKPGCSITGGEVYRGKALPELHGVYFYADYCTSIVRSFVWSKDGVRAHWDWKLKGTVSPAISEISSFGVDHDGELYIVSLKGSIYRLERAL